MILICVCYVGLIFFDLLTCMYKSVQSDGALLSTYLHNRSLNDSSYDLVSDVLGF